MDYNISIDPKKVKGTNISKYSDGYNYASITTKVGDGEYMSVSYEWKGDTIPEFALMTMEIMKSSGNENANLEEDVITCERAAKHFTEMAAKMKKKKEFKEWVKDKDTDNEEDMDEDKKKKKKEKEKEKK